MGQAARERVSREFSWAAHCASLDKLIQELAETKPLETKPMPKLVSNSKYFALVCLSANGETIKFLRHGNTKLLYKLPLLSRLTFNEFL